MKWSSYNFFHYDSAPGRTEKYLGEAVNEKYDRVYAEQIFEALDMARCAYAGQLKYNTIPYIIHPMRVALMLLKFEQDTISKIFTAALLHDVLEKTSITSQKIEEHFGRYVAKLVQSVTKQPGERQSSQEKTEAKRQNWLDVILGSHEARMIKACEELDNMICWKFIPEDNPGRKMIPRWLAEAREMSLPLAHMTNLEVYNFMRQEYGYYVEQGFAN